MPDSAALPPCTSVVCWSDTLVPPVPTADGSPSLVTASGPVPPRLALLELLHARVHALAAENRALQRRNHLLAVALDDALDRASAHALCCDNEQLLTTAAARHSDRFAGSVSSPI
ncbi:hypothetical protein [Nocardia alni]|uniref:hypothetical protein n=1 Tax=Nocardia alni TaxID=2815723 RepID=UPI001C24CF71|nr:hypothetical protein [Nocardia alni]